MVPLDDHEFEDSAKDRGLNGPRDLAPFLQLSGEQRRQRLSKIFLRDEWPLRAASKLLALLPLLASSHERGGMILLSLVGIAVALDVAGGVLSWLDPEASQSRLRQVARWTLGMVLPMLLFGAGIGIWILMSPFRHWELGIATIAAVSLINSVTSSHRLSDSIASQVSVWLGFALVVGRDMALLSLLSAVAISILAGLAHGARLREHEASRAAEALVHNRARDIMSGLEETGRGWFWETDRSGCLTYLSGPFAHALGKDLDTIIGIPLEALFDCEDGEAATSVEALRSVLQTHETMREITVMSRDPDRWWALTGMPTLSQAGELRGFRGWASDCTDQRQSRAAVTRMANTDALTGVANRYRLSRVLTRLIGQTQLDDQEVAVLLVDLDRFKQVNDLHGHLAGDELLREVARRIERTVGPLGLVGRQGGDEFLAVIAGASRNRLEQLGRAIISRLERSFLIGDTKVHIGASVGIAVGPTDGETAEALLRNADSALYRAKGEGRGCIRFFTPDMKADAAERQELAQDLKQAMIRGGLEIAYQPIVEAGSEAITSCEALLRWDHPIHGPVAPSRLLAIAEESGLIGALGEWTIQTACRDALRWPDHVRVAINISSFHFANPAFPALMARACAAAGISPSRIELELTESVFQNSGETNQANFASLQNLGVRLTLDDFGTGNVSLAYLRMAPFSRVKVDGEFVREAMDSDTGNAALIRSIVALADELGMESVAEGVEHPDELLLVRELGCSHVQGFIYERPVPAEALEGLLDGSKLAASRDGRLDVVPRRKALRRVSVGIGAQEFSANLRNLSATGAMIEGLPEIDAGATVEISLAGAWTAGAVVRWCDHGRCGVEFVEELPVQGDASGISRTSEAAASN